LSYGAKRAAGIIPEAIYLSIIETADTMAVAKSKGFKRECRELREFFIGFIRVIRRLA